MWNAKTFHLMLLFNVNKIEMQFLSCKNNYKKNASKRVSCLNDMPCRHLGLIINGEEVEKVTSFKWLVVCIEADPVWSLNISHPKKPTKKDFSEDRTAGILASLLHNKKNLQRVVKTAQWIIRSSQVRGLPLNPPTEACKKHLQRPNPPWIVTFVESPLSQRTFQASTNSVFHWTVDYLLNSKLSGKDNLRSLKSNTVSWTAPDQLTKKADCTSEQ